ncbi:hypothetical protein [Candidatus Bathycorpusculum sp.]|uniref:hypothetical protein n=1 Tax=Candidatus Bathycorpusculum sp. TaxID=2994959 RepID=UPI00282C94A8|nr:hypothetical protein [Candidatus Termitimicrobium sp.]
MRGSVISIEKNYANHGMGLYFYHYFRYYICLSITEVVWSSDTLSYTFGSSWNDTSSPVQIIGIGYDYETDLSEVEVGQTIECTGHYRLYTETPYSNIITVMPTVTGSSLIPLPK